MADSDIEAKFHSAVSMIQSLPKEGPYQTSNETKLKFYALYKQSTVGPCNTTRPGFWDYVNRVKWDAWNTLGQMSKADAMAHYIDELRKILESMPHSKDMVNLMTGDSLASKLLTPSPPDEEEEFYDSTEQTDSNLPPLPGQGGQQVKEIRENGQLVKEVEGDAQPDHRNETSEQQTQIHHHQQQQQQQRQRPQQQYQHQSQGDNVLTLSSGVEETLHRVSTAMQSILQRLTTLEQLVQTQSSAQQARRLQVVSWLDRPWKVLLLLILWPALVNFVFKLVKSYLL